MLVFPDAQCPTGGVYREFDRQFDGDPAARALAARLQSNRVRALSEMGVNADSPFNDLAEPACRLEPRLAQTRDIIDPGFKVIVMALEDACIAIIQV